MDAKMMATAAVLLCLLGTGADAELKLHTHAKVANPPEVSSRRRKPYVPIVKGRLLFDYYRDYHGDRGRSHRRPRHSISVTFPGGYWSLGGGSTFYDPGYLYWPQRSRTTVIIGRGTNTRRIGDSYYIYDPTPYVCAPPVYPSNVDYTNYVVVNSPTVPAQKDVEQANVIRVPPEPEPASSYASELAPMLGGADKVDAAFALGEAKLRQGAWPEAANALALSVRARPNDPTRRMALALALAGADQHRAAAAALRVALGNWRDLGAVRLDPVNVFGSDGAYEDLVMRLSLAAELAPEDADVSLLLAFVQFAGGRDEEASRLLWGLHDRGPTDPVVARLLLEVEARLRAARETAEQEAADTAK